MEESASVVKLPASRKAVRFDRAPNVLTATIAIDPAIAAPTELYVPARQFPDGYAIYCGDARVETDGQIVRIHAQRDGPLTIRVAAL